MGESRGKGKKIDEKERKFSLHKSMENLREDAVHEAKRNARVAQRDVDAHGKY